MHSNGGACAEDLFDGSLGDQQVFSGEGFMDRNRHSPADEIERNLVGLEEALREFSRAPEVFMFQHGDVKQIFESGLVVAI